MDRKKCPSCGETKDKDQFSKNKARYDGLASVCKLCANIYREKWRRSDSGREKHNLNCTRWKESNPDKYKTISRNTDKERNARVTDRETIKCSRCGEVGGLEMFPRSRISRGSGYCKECVKIYNKKSKENINKKPKDDFMRLTSKLYTTQRKSCKERSHEKPEYTLNEFREWIKNNDNFYKILEQWVSSGFKLTMKPTVDRINPFKTYSFSNIRVITVGENNSKSQIDKSMVYGLIQKLYATDTNVQAMVDKLFLGEQ